MTGSNRAGLAAAMTLVVQGEDDDRSGITCISDVLANNDSLTIRRVNSCEQGSANCADVAGAPYFQASLCSNSSELLSLDYHDWFRLDTTETNLNRTKRDCSTAASKRRRSEEHTTELQSLISTSFPVFCLNKQI